MITAIGAIAGASIGTEIVVITVGIVAGSTVSWWLLGGLGFAAGGLAGGAAGSYIADAVADKKPARRH